MRNQITALASVLFIFYSFASFAQSIKFEDRMNGDNSVTGLQSRGWVILNEDGGGVTAPWFQGNPTVFPSFEGPDTGYVASNYNGANANFVVDQWLISPAINVTQGDSLSFLARSPDSSAYDDSINILISPTAGTTPSSFVDLGRFLVSKNGWGSFFVLFNINSTVRFAIRYYMFDSQTNANFLGLDLFQLYTKSSTYPSSISINKSFSFTDVTKTESYRMIGLPGQTNFAIPVTGTRKTDWNCFYDNGAATNYLVEYDGSANFHFKPGNGFWLLSKNQININTQVISVTLAGDNTYSIPLHTGWNIISNPFERSTQWSAVQTANGLAGNIVIYDWNGNWTQPASFIPYKAYYFNNVTGLGSLKIPYDPSGVLPKNLSEEIVGISDADNIKISLLQNGEEKSKVFIGFNAQSTNDFDEKDYFVPPGDFENARIVIRNNDLSTNYKYLMKESRSEIGEGQIYFLEVKNLIGEELTLKFEGLSNYQDYLVYLVDDRLNNSIKLSDEYSEVKIPAHVKNTSYRLLIGNQTFVEANKGNLYPALFALYQNYPNPFNPTTTIRYSVPITSKVNIKIFDLLGNELKTLMDEEKSPGNYEVEFDASPMASGVYICKIQAGLFTQSKKMILLR